MHMVVTCIESPFFIRISHLYLSSLCVSLVMSAVGPVRSVNECRFSWGEKV